MAGTDRFNPFPLVASSFTSLKKRHRNEALEKPDWVARLVVALIPLTGAIGAGYAAWNSQFAVPADKLLAGVAVLAGALVASFTQVAGWRERLTMTPGVEDYELRRLDETAAHTLAGAAAGLVASVLLMAVTLVPRPAVHEWEFWRGLYSLLSGLTVFVTAYSGVLTLVSIPIIWGVYQQQHEDRGED